MGPAQSAILYVANMLAYKTADWAGLFKTFLTLFNRRISNLGPTDWAESY